MKVFPFPLLPSDNEGARPWLLDLVESVRLPILAPRFHSESGFGTRFHLESGFGNPAKAGLNPDVIQNCSGLPQLKIL